MRSYSLGTKVSIAFIFCLLFLFVLFILLQIYENELNLRKFKDRHLQSVNYLLTLYQNDTPPHDIETYFKNFGLKNVTDESLEYSILHHGHIIFQQDTNLGKFSAIIYKDKHYLYIENNDIRLVLESENGIFSDNIFLAIFFGIFTLIVWLYISTLKSIEPIKELSRKVRRLASGDTNVHYNYDREDEIGELSQEFNRSVSTIRNLLNSRTLFLRTIMHELKTPIGKGRIVAEMLDDEQQKFRLIKVFKRLEVLINEFTKIEQVVTNNYILKKQPYSLKEIITAAIDILMFEPYQVEQKICLELGRKKFLMEVDLDLMALAFKNLMDNAIKYGSDNFVKVQFRQGVLSFYNSGEPLEKPIEEFKQAFVSSSMRDKMGSGMGLGLYIVNNILIMHDLKLHYEYKDGFHRFFINLIKA